jgi:outer membrane protein OmpA-like peptidoglycan-associated protein
VATNNVALNLIDSLTKEFTGDTLAKIASAVGEPQSKVQSAVGGLGPAVIAALAAKASTAYGLTEVFELMRNSGFDGSSARDLAGEIGGAGSVTDFVTRGAPVVASLFGARQSSVVDWLASFAGIGSKSATSLLSMAAPTVLGLLGSAARKSGGFNPSALSGLLASQGALLRDKAPAGLASALGLPNFASLGILSDQVTRPRTDVRPAPVVEKSGVGWWPWLLIPLLLLLGWWWFANRAPVGTVNPRLAIANDEGKIVCSASVRDETTRAAILTALHAAFGDGTNCDVAIDPNVKVASWLPNLGRIFAALKRPGADFTLDGTAVQFGGWLSAADRKAIGDDLRGVFGADYSFGEATDKAAAYVSDAGSKALAALTALGTTWAADSFVSAMNLAVINFPTGTSEIPADAQNLIARAATVLKTAPKGTVIEIGGHTDNVGDAASNMTLSQARADAVRQALVNAGVDGAMVVAKGHGDTKPVASNDSEYGRFRNRRIEYSIPASVTK